MELHHVGIAVRDLEEATGPYLLLGYEVEAEGEVAAQGVRVRMLRSGASRVELLLPLDPGSAVGRFLARRGPGLHHLAFRTENIEAELHRLREAGAPLIDQAPRPGFGGHRVAFVHPRWAGGVLVELVEE